MEYEIEVLNEQEFVPVDEDRFHEAVTAILRDARLEEAKIEILLVDDEEIRALNARFLNHDTATDVISFTLQRDERFLEGQVVLSGETAARSAVEYGWSGADEMLLYLVHGVLHLTGYEDTTDESRRQMRTREREFLAGFGLTPPWEDDESLEF